MLLDPKKEIVYGPVNSRRLGRSLGLNILPAGKKCCPFNCVYCQYGWTQNPSARIQSRAGFPSVADVVDALRIALAQLNRPPAYITFSGNGEPTLHPDFPLMVEAVNSIRNRLSPESKTAVLSNSVLLDRAGVRRALAELDVRIMKFDCGLPGIFERYNQPCENVRLEGIIDGLSLLEDVTIQALLTTGRSGNCSRKNIEAWIDGLRAIRPVVVQIYTLDRGYPHPGLKPAPREELLRIQTLVEKAHVSCEVY